MGEIDSMEGPVDVKERVEPPYTLMAGDLPAAAKAIARANRRLERAGAAGRFTYTVREWVKPVQHGRRTDHYAVVDLTLARPVIAVSGWEFIATLVHEQGGAVIVRTRPGRQLGDLLADRTPRCDHCGRARYRKDTYVVHNPVTGRTMQLGRSCLRPFLGMSPSGLWALTFDPTGELHAGGGSDGGGVRRDLRIPVRRVLAVALACSDHGREFVSRAEAGPDRTATAGLVGDALFFRSRTDRAFREWLHGIDAATAEIEAQATEIDAVLATGRALDDDTDYGRNIRTVVDLEWADHRNVGLITSLVRVHYAELARRAEKLTWAAGFLGQAGDRLTAVPATITTLRSIAGIYATNTLIIAQTPDGHALKWFASGSKPDLDQGMAVTVTARIKATDTWQGIDQTVISRAKISPIATE